MHAISLGRSGFGDGVGHGVQRAKHVGLALVIGLAIALLVQLTGCATHAPGPQGPLPTSGATVAAPAGCLAKRQRGGAC